MIIYHASVSLKLAWTTHLLIRVCFLGAPSVQLLFSPQNPSVQHTPRLHTKKPSVQDQRPLSSTLLSSIPETSQFHTLLELRGLWCGTEGCGTEGVLVLKWGGVLNWGGGGTEGFLCWIEGFCVLHSMSIPKNTRE